MGVTSKSCDLDEGYADTLAIADKELSPRDLKAARWDAAVGKTLKSYSESI